MGRFTVKVLITTGGAVKVLAIIIIIIINIIIIIIIFIYSWYNVEKNE